MQISIALTPSTRLVTDASEAYAATAQALLERLRPVALAMQSDTRNETGLEWAALELRHHGAEVEVREPDYRHEPTRFVRSLDMTCAVFSAQRQLLDTLHLTQHASPVSVEQYVRVATAALHTTSVLAWRSVEKEEPFTGWQFALATDAQQATKDDEEEAGLYSVRELAALRIAWITALVLPPEWACRFVGNTLLDCAGPDGQTHPVFLSFDL